MSDIANVHLFLDLETTGLKVGRDAILEMAWTFTDENFVMITPLRQRLTCLQPPSAFRPDEGPRAGGMFNPSKPDHWNFAQHFDNHEIVSSMHRQSGLTSDHIDVDPDAVLRHPRDFERLFLDDLVRIRQNYGQFGKIILSGAGVSHFDVHMLACFWPHLFPLLPPPDSLMAYWHCDTSVAARLLPPMLLEKARAWARSPESRFYLACETVPDIPYGPDSSIEQHTSGQRAFSIDGVVAHRAADDVIASLVDARLIRDIENIVLTSRSDIG